MRPTVEHQSSYIGEAPPAWSNSGFLLGKPTMIVLTDDATVVASAESFPNSGTGIYEAGFICNSEGVFVAEWRATASFGGALRARMPFNVIRTREGET